MSESGLRIGASVFFLAVFGYAAYEMSRVPLLAGGFPLVVSGAGGLLALISIAVEVSNSVARLKAGRVEAQQSGKGVPGAHGHGPGPGEHGEHGERAERPAGATTAELRHLGRAAYYLAWTLGFVGIVWLVGGLLGTWLFLTVFFIVETKAARPFWIFGPLGAVAVLWLLETALRAVRWPDGVLGLF